MTILKKNPRRFSELKNLMTEIIYTMKGLNSKRDPNEFIIIKLEEVKKLPRL